MFERFTEKAIKVIMLAQEEARRLGHNFVGTEQILLGLLGEGTGIAAKALKAKGLNLKDTRVQVENIIGRGSGFISVEIPFTPRAKRLIELAWEESRSLGTEYIGPEHLLLGLMREGTGVACTALENANVDFTVLKGDILKLINERGASASTAVRAAESQSKQDKPSADEGESGVSDPLFERFTKKAIKVIMLAQEEARRLGHNIVGTEQILLGLIGESTGIAAKALKEKGVNLKDARIEVEKIIGRGSGFIAVEIPFTPRAKEALTSAWHEARALGHNYIGTEHLLLGLVREGEGVAARVLENLGVGLDTIRPKILKLIAESPKEASKEPPLLKLDDQTIDRIFVKTLGVHESKVAAQKSALSSPSIDKYTENLSQEPPLPSIDKFSDSVMQVILLARAECRRLGHNQLGTEQLLIALIEENKGISGKVLQLLGLNLDKTRETCEQIVAKGSQLQATYIRFTPRSNKIFVDSKKIASMFGSLLIKKEHLLLALFDETEGIGARLMKNLGVEVQKGKDELLKLIAEQSADE